MNFKWSGKWEPLNYNTPPLLNMSGLVPPPPFSLVISGLVHPFSLIISDLVQVYRHSRNCSCMMMNKF